MDTIWNPSHTPAWEHVWWTPTHEDLVQRAFNGAAFGAATLNKADRQAADKLVKVGLATLIPIPGSKNYRVFLTDTGCVVGGGLLNR